MDRRAFVGQLAVAAAVLPAGCVNTAPANETQVNDNMTTTNQTMDETNRTESDGAKALYPPLPGLITAENRTAYVAEHNLEYEAGAVDVEIILEGEERPAEYLENVVRQYDELVLATVAVENLRPLANDSRVRAVRQPSQPRPT